MDGLTTPYEDDSATEFMECSVCEISLRGLDLYKIHVTTPGHLKKEDAAVAAGHMVREHIVPKFNDILQYVDYLKLDEPIIGLTFLEEVPSLNVDHSSMGPRYTCTLCNLTAYPPEMLHHVIGRKHRQKYIETKRPDLVSWDKQSVVVQTGKMIRTRAEIIARQDGSGRPKPMKKMKNLENRLTRVPPWQRPNEDPQTASGPHQWKQEFQDSDRGSLMPDLLSRPPFVPVEARPVDAAGGRQTTKLWGQQVARADDWERAPLHGKNLDLDYRLNNPVTQKGKVESHKETQWGWDQSAEGYATYREPQAKNEFLTKDGGNEFQPPRLDHQPLRLDHQPPRPDYQTQRPGFQGDDQRWSSDKDQGVRLGTDVPKPPARNVRLPLDKPTEHFRDYNHGMGQADPFSAGPTNSQTPREVSRSMSAIPEPFRRFMSSPAGDEANRRKRKSRFSDATPEEVAVANRMFNARPPDAKLRAPLESGGGTFQQETGRTMWHSDRFSQSQQNNPALPQMSSEHSYERTFRDESNFRRAKDGYGGEGNGGRRDWNNTRDGQQVFQQQGRREPSDLNRNRYEAGFGQQQMYTTRHLDERAQCPERFQGGGQQQLHFQQRDLQPFSQGGVDSRSPPLDLERPVGMHRNPQYSKSLQKLTSTILEFMSRNSSYSN